jgi:hypothetical protein
MEQNKSPVVRRGFCFARNVALGEFVVDGAEGIADLGAKQAHDGDYDDGDEGENDRVLNQTLTFFLWSE